MIKSVVQFYYQGFRTMRVGRKLWAIILIKLFVMFAVLKTFFFPNYLKATYSDDQERANHVLEQFTAPAQAGPRDPR
ncbi:MAG: DUF4492 domain-containing protein [Thermodesulfobacteriota bacterium]